MFIVTKQIDSENISKLCRTCLREDEEKMVCLFVGPAGSSLAAKLRSLSCLEVWQGDGLPEKLCERCVTRAESALLFREQCRAADRALRQAALKVSGLTTYTTVSGCKLYQQNRGFTPVQNAKKTLKCGECGAVFMDHKELCAHSRLHGTFTHETTSLPHMHIVESQNAYFNAETSLNESVVYNNDISTMSHSRRTGLISQHLDKNDRPACALHCPLCNHTFPNRNQLINHNFSHCTDAVDVSCDNDSIETDDHCNVITDHVDYSHTIDLAHSSENTSHSMTIPRMTFPESSSLHTSMPLETNNCTSHDIISDGDASISAISNQNLRFSPFPNAEQKSRMSNDTETLSRNNEKANEVQTANPENTPCLHVRKIYECNKCTKVFTQKSKLITHELFHTGEKPFICGNCDKAYASKSKLNAHMKLHTRMDVHQCDICEKTFPYPSYLLEHSKVHRAKSNDDVVIDIPLKAKFECSTCSKKFRLKKNLKSHMKFHIGTGLFNCEICDKSFSEEYNLKVHLRCHKGIKLHKCEYCEKAFNEKGNYKEHLRIHTKVKPFTCKLCDKAFAQSSHLKSHQASHNSIRPHQCRLCGKRFKLVSHLKRHTNSHTAIKTFECMECNQMFAQAFSLKRHLKRHREAIVYQ